MEAIAFIKANPAYFPAHEVFAAKSAGTDLDEAVRQFFARLGLPRNEAEEEWVLRHLQREATVKAFVCALSVAIRERLAELSGEFWRQVELELAN